MAVWTQIIISTSGGGTITLYSPSSGSIDGSNTVFGFSTKPTTIVSDGGTYKENKGWTWNSSTLEATMAVAPSYDIFGMK